MLGQFVECTEFLDAEPEFMNQFNLRVDEAQLQVIFDITVLMQIIFMYGFVGGQFLIGVWSQMLGVRDFTP